MVLHQYDYIFAIGTIFAFLDAYNIGAFPLLSLRPVPYLCSTREILTAAVSSRCQ